MASQQSFYMLQIDAAGDEFACQVRFDVNHPILRGHFPGNPVVPGAWLIQILKEAMEQIKGMSLVIRQASQVKFLQPVIPSTSMVLILKGEIVEYEELFKVSATYSFEGTIHAKIKLTLNRL